MNMAQASDTELYSEYKEKFSNEWSGAFDLFCGMGKSPRIITASIEYVTTEKNQRECAKEWETTTTSIGSTYPSVLEYANQQGIGVDFEEHTTSRPDESKLDVVYDIIELLGWSEDEEYSIYRDGRGVEQSATIRKSGYQQIRDELKIESGSEE